MTDENKDDEYQFAELDGNQVFDEASGSDDGNIASRSGDNNPKKFILIGVGVVIVGFLVYKFVTPMMSGDSSGTSNQAGSTKPVTKVATNKPNSKPKPQPVVVPKVEPKPVVQQPVVYQQPQVRTITKTVQDPQIKNKLNDLQDSSLKASRNINRINSNLGSLQQTLETLSSKLNSMNSNITMLAQELQNQQQALKKLKEKPKKKLISKRVVIPRKTYYIQAIIPGRAWLKSNKGDTITVVEGSIIRGWGRVKLIDPHQGQVVLASGKVIKFSASDT